MISSKACTNSTYWQNYRLVSIVLLAVGILAFFIISLLLIRYLYIKDKGKRNKKVLFTYGALIIASLLVFTSGAFLSKHIEEQTKDLNECYLLDEEE